jgi:hypothetical protein
MGLGPPGLRISGAIIPPPMRDSGFVGHGAEVVDDQSRQPVAEPRANGTLARRHASTRLINRATIAAGLPHIHPTNTGESVRSARFESAVRLGWDPADWAGLPREPGGSCTTAT